MSGKRAWTAGSYPRTWRSLPRRLVRWSVRRPIRPRGCELPGPGQNLRQREGPGRGYCSRRFLTRAPRRHRPFPGQAPRRHRPFPGQAPRHHRRFPGQAPRHHRRFPGQAPSRRGLPCPDLAPSRRRGRFPGQAPSRRLRPYPDLVPSRCRPLLGLAPNSRRLEPLARSQREFGFLAPSRRRRGRHYRA